MHLYAYMEDEMHALALHKQFDSYEETQMLLPLAVLYYKLNQFDKAEDYIKRLAKANKDTKKFLRAAARDQLDDYIVWIPAVYDGRAAGRIDAHQLSVQLCAILLRMGK